MAHDVIIQAEGLGKKYVIGHQSAERYTALRDVVSRAAKNLARTTRDILRGKALVAGDELEEFWALKDVSFEIKRGDVVGIIGRNGAGKSTLLKVLSRITEPTEGRITIDGRVASLLEVGTGFHPELTGRENIFLNGAILGMARAETTRKFDEIVDFAGVENFLDTPVKRYSSGMYVRLAFAVAAHLEPEILIVDEVLAVGDAEFQKKCLGKMKNVAGNGRTVLFVSHNMTALQSLCRTGILLEKGRVGFVGRSDELIEKYLNYQSQVVSSLAQVRDRSGAGSFIFYDAVLYSSTPENQPRCGGPLTIEVKIRGPRDVVPAEGRIAVAFYNRHRDLLFDCTSDVSCIEPLKFGEDTTAILKIDRLPLSGGEYYLSFYLEIQNEIEDWIEYGLLMQVEDTSFYGTVRNTPPAWQGKTTLVDHAWRAT